MITKRPADNKGHVKVTFSLPMTDRRVAVVGDFNGWDESATPLRKRGDKRSASVKLDAGRSYAFRYVDEDGHWFDDDGADYFQPNELGGANCVIDLRDRD